MAVIEGYCPVQGCEYEIEVDYMNIPTLGGPDDNYKVAFRYCEYGDDNNCSYLISPAACPVVARAQSQP